MEKIAIFSFSDKKEVFELSFPSFKKYCKIHNYKFFPFFETLCNDCKPHWNKILYAIKLLQENNEYDYFVWLDHDIIIKNFQISLIDIIKEYKFDKSNSQIMMSNDPVSNYSFNTGSIVIKNNNKSLEIFKEFYNLKINPNQYSWAEKQWKYTKNGYDFTNGLQDTRVMNIYFKQYPETLLTIPHRILQSFFDKKFYQHGDFCGHVVSYQGRVLETKMKQLNDNILPWEQK
jgi:hypothetical protein|tara:strand:- start:496 stop:1188 length:693 start_codon:yes stop_codon:yes gene_type:complete